MIHATASRIVKSRTRRKALIDGAHMNVHETVVSRFRQRSVLNQPQTCSAAMHDVDVGYRAMSPGHV